MLNNKPLKRLAFAAVLAGVAVAHPVAALTALPPLSDESVRRLLSNYVQTWSADEQFNPTTMARFYADSVTYYGKRMSRAAVLGDKRRYIATWPERRYSIVPGSHAVSCNADHSACVVSGVMVWDRRSAAGSRTTGSARLKILVNAESGGRIVRESATILSQVGQR